MLAVYAIARDLRAHALLRKIEWGMAIGMIAVGSQLLRGGNMISSVPSYSVMAMFASEDHLGWTALTLGFFRFVALFFNGTFRWFREISPLIRMGTSLLGVPFWFFMGISIMLANSCAPGVPLFALALFADVDLAQQVAKEYRRVRKGGSACQRPK